MSRVSVFIFILGTTVFMGACGSAESNSNANSVVGAGNVNVDPNNLPPGLSTSPIPPSANTTPGIPDPKEAANVLKGGTPTPGIPDAANLKKPFKPGATPTPGIPDPETLRKQMQGNKNMTGPPPVQGDEPMMKKRTAAPVNKP
ncbi:MAG TPA: hypothetical protein VMZ26_13715 [Pyrinomonadaceae bacterium]|nr:hypothetical protein [Pyrinomonadaceae bacterium]